MGIGMNLSEAEINQLLWDSYRRSPALYAKQILGVTWWKRQLDISIALMEHKKVFVQASHAVGKSFLAAGLVNWHFDSFDPSITITTAPNAQQVKDVLWKEIRVQRGDRGGGSWLLPKEPRMEHHAAHFAVGMTARDSNAMQGRHEERIGIVFDEAVGIDSQFYDAAEGMMTNANEGAWWLAICNPTDTSTRAYQEVLTGDWYVMDISAMTHPNIHAALHGLPLPFPKAVGVGYIDTMVRKYAEEIDPRDKRVGDIMWSLPDETGKRDLSNPRWYRPGPMMENRVLGRWPSNTTGSIWSDAMWRAAERREDDGFKPLPESCDEEGCKTFWDKPAQFGCDVAWSGADYTSIVGRRGGAALHWETHNGWGVPAIANGLKEAAYRQVEEHKRRFRHLQNYVGEEAMRTLIVVDHDATGHALKEHMAGWNLVTQSGNAPPIDEEAYPNRRSENWFSVAEMADRGELDFSRLSQDGKNKLRGQAMSPLWTIDALGRRVVEKKDITRKRLKRSPDDMDALNLAFCKPSAVIMRMGVQTDGNGRIVGIGTGRIRSAGPEQSIKAVAAKHRENVGADLGGMRTPLGGEFVQSMADRVLSKQAERISSVREGKPRRRLM